MLGQERNECLSFDKSDSIILYSSLGFRAVLI